MNILMLYFSITFGKILKEIKHPVLAGWHHWLDGHESQWTPGVGDGQGGLECCNSWGRKELDTTERLIWSDLIWCYIHTHTQIKQNINNSFENIVQATFHPSTISLEQPPCPLSKLAVDLWLPAKLLKTAVLKCQFNFSEVVDTHARFPHGLLCKQESDWHTSQFWLDLSPRLTLSQPWLSISPTNIFKLAFWMFSEILYKNVKHHCYLNVLSNKMHQNSKSRQEWC